MAVIDEVSVVQALGDHFGLQFARTPTVDEWLQANDNAPYRVDLTNIDVAELIARDRR